VLQKFLVAMKGKLTKEENEAEEREMKERGEMAKKGKTWSPKPLPVYFPERLPKLHNLACLIKTLFDIIRAIINRIGTAHKYGSLYKSFDWLREEVEKVSKNALDGLTDIFAFMYFAVRNGTQYTEAVKKVGKCGQWEWV
jgi:hypothetical protein